MQKQRVQTDKAPSAIGPYSQAIKAGGFVFLSGQIPLDPSTGKLVGEDIQSQAKQVMQNLKEVLSAAGTDFNSVVKATIFLKDFNDFGIVNEIYGSYFSEPFPARATVQVAKLPLDVRVEIELIASI